MSNQNISDLAMKGQDLSKRMKSLSKELEAIKVALRGYAQGQLVMDTANAVYDYTDPSDELTITAQVRFPPSSISLPSEYCEKVVSLIGKQEFDRLFTIKSRVVANTAELENLDPSIAEILGDYITLKENTPRVNFK